MPLHFWRERGCAIVSFEGEYDAGEALRSIDAALAETPAAAGLLLDLTDSVSFRKRSSEDLRHIATFLSQRRELFGSCLAAVGRSDLTYGLLRMGTVFTTEHGIEAEAFRSRERALDWLKAPVTERADLLENSAPPPRHNEAEDR